MNEEARDYQTDCSSSGLEWLIESMSRLEELYLLTQGNDIGPVFASRRLRKLRVLQADHLTLYPLRLLATNPAMTRLTSLGFHPQGIEPSRRPVPAPSVGCPCTASCRSSDPSDFGG